MIDRLLRLSTLVFLTYILFTSPHELQAQELAILKYDGGGDWYANPTAVPNLISFCNQQLGTQIVSQPRTVEADSEEIMNYPIVFMTGHGNITLNTSAVENLRAYLSGGGFLHISDNYGFDPFIRREMKKVFPDIDFVEIPFDHPIYHQQYNIDQLPKIHEHDGKPAQGFGLILDGRLICFYDYESDLSDGWEDQVVHNNPENKRRQALEMGANIVKYAFTH